ncbi:cell wall mannoprotein 1 [Colletotrichum spaethianum]|uniref:Cell wall mannoprotein 1 n=1 Tax=Colletotrichum spaethianum TaxID=700344 RepID=A0AA37PC57_9PEZI|nr:cell wall mannoprotein 1 [Colletotrichum spaethianum]GKT49512.1 cell wall mannoprotein 1 [Colletotrichum spaethianum]
MHGSQVLLVALQAWAIAAGPVLVPRQKDVITGALGMVQSSLKQLDTAVNKLSATDANSAVGVLNAAQGAQSMIEKATSQISNADNLGLFGALGLQQTATDLVGQVQTTLGDLEKKKPVFDQLGVTSVVSDALQQQKSGSGQLGDMLLSKVPAIARPIAQKSTGQLTEAIDSAIATFKKPAAAKPAAPAAPAKPPAAPAAPAVAAAAAAAAAA